MTNQQCKHWILETHATGTASIQPCPWCEIERLQKWVTDLQSGLYVNCVYCGHRYGPGETTPVSMADALKAHVEQCPAHPMSALKTLLVNIVTAHRDTGHIMPEEYGDAYLAIERWFDQLPEGGGIYRVTDQSSKRNPRSGLDDGTVPARQSGSSAVDPAGECQHVFMYSARPVWGGGYNVVCSKCRECHGFAREKDDAFLAELNAKVTAGEYP